MHSKSSIKIPHSFHFKDSAFILSKSIHTHSGTMCTDDMQ